jgi:CBS domain-containing protein
MDSIREMLAAKSLPGVVVTTPRATVREATTLMNDHGIGSLLVISEKRLVGIFTERDVLRRVVAEGRSPDVTPVGEVMTGDVLCCGPQAGVDEVADLMRRHRVRHVPVIDADDEVLGLVSIGDINAWRFASCETVLHQMEEYLYRRA